MKLNMNKEELKETAQDARRALERERERRMEDVERVDGLLRVMDATDELLAEIDHLNEKVDEKDEEMENLRQQLQEEREKNQALEIKMAEMSKLSAGVAKKASQDDLQKALRIFLNISKRKMIGKREVAKTVITEMITSAKLTLPDDIMDMLDHLDDEQPEAKVVNVQGNYNDIHDNGNVNRA